MCAWVIFNLPCTLCPWGWQKWATDVMLSIIKWSPYRFLDKVITHFSHVPTCIRADGLHLFSRPYVWIFMYWFHGKKVKHLTIWISFPPAVHIFLWSSYEHVPFLSSRGDISPSLTAQIQKYYTNVHTRKLIQIKNTSPQATYMCLLSEVKLNFQQGWAWRGALDC